MIVDKNRLKKKPKKQRRISLNHALLFLIDVLRPSSSFHKTLHVHVDTSVGVKFDKWSLICIWS